MRIKLLLAVASTSIMLTVAGTHPGRACAYDGLLPDGLVTAHPRSVSVAIAVRQAMENGELPAEFVPPSTAGNAGYWTAVRRLEAFRRSLPTEDVPSQGFAVLLVDSNLWSRLTPVPGGHALFPHEGGTKLGDVVVVTAEAVLDALEDKRLTMGEAIASGLLVVDGETAQAKGVERLVARSSSEMRPGGWVRPARLLVGPNRR